jgi:hypothetical protein
MALSVVKRTGQPVTISWDYLVSDEGLIDNFTIESSPNTGGPFTSFAAVAPSARSKAFTAPDVQTFYRVVAVKNGGASTPSPEVVQVIIDNSPPAATNLSVI